MKSTLKATSNIFALKPTKGAKVLVGKGEYIAILPSEVLITNLLAGEIIVASSFTGAPFIKHGSSSVIRLDKNSLESLRKQIGSNFLKLDEWNYYPI